MASKEVKIGKYWFYFGYNFKHVGLGFRIDRWTIQVDLIFFWFGWEF